ncbi:hypothetical protein PanWU01x14_050500 [Parasponia andersonii]|uniref:Uncharacterized protein n=1 Tax=Parasponia andersonii TaxID=3476 RepID=A0A2P5DLR2_PARAD|nr:hypothetical protein PanWU01x14_050500 [Parasponia andersonii]
MSSSFFFFDDLATTKLLNLQNVQANEFKWRRQGRRHPTGSVIYFQPENMVTKKLATLAIYLFNQREGTNLTFKKVVAAFRVCHCFTLRIQASDELLYGIRIVAPFSCDDEKDYEIYYLCREEESEEHYFSFDSSPEPTPLPLVDPTWNDRQKARGAPATI